MSYSWLGNGSFWWIEWWFKPGFIASLSTYLYESRIKFHYIDNNVLRKQKDIICNMSERGHGSQHCVITLITVKTIILTTKNEKAYIQSR